MAKLYFKVGSDWEEVVRLRNEIVKLKQELMSMDGTQSPAAFKALNAQLTASNQRLDELVTNAAKAGAEMETGFKRKIFDASQVVNGFTEKILAQKAVVKDIEADVKRLGDAYRIALKRNPLSANSKLEEYNAAKKALDEEKAALFGLTQEQANARLSVKKLRDEYALYKNDGKQVVETNNGIAISWKKALGVIGGTAMLKSLISDVTRVRIEIDSVSKSFEALLKSESKAKEMIGGLKELSIKSGLNTYGAAQTLLGFNVDAEKVLPTLKSIGDITMGNNEKFSSMTLAFAQMSAAGRLMGQDLNQMINAGFNPLQVISEKTGKSIAVLKKEMEQGAISSEMVADAFAAATSEGGRFYNMLEKQNTGIRGERNKQNAVIKEKLNEIGEANEELIAGSYRATTYLIQNYETVGKVLAGLVVTYGTYRTAVMLVTAAESKHTFVEIGLTNARLLARKAQLALNAAMLTNPYVLLATAVIGLGAAMWAFHDSTTAAEKAQKRFDEQKKQSIKKEQEHKQRLEELISTLQNEYTSSMDRVKAMDAIKNEYPALFQKYIDEKGHIRDLIALWKEYNEEAGKRNVEENKINYNNSKKLIDEYEQVIGLWKRFGEDPNFHKNSLNESEKQLADKYRNETLFTLKSKIDEERNILIAYQKEVRSDELAQWQLDLKKNTDVQIKSELNEMKRLQQARKNNKWYSLNVGIGSLKGATTESELQSRIDILESELKSRKTSTYQQDLAKAKSDWEKAKKGYEVLLKDQQATSEQVKKAREDMLSKEKAYKDLGGITGSSLTKQDNQTEKLRKQTDEYNALLDKQSLEQQRSAEDLQMEVDEARIKAMDEGSAKTIAEMELNFEKEMQAIDRQKEDAFRKKVEDARAAWEANPKNKGKSFNATDIKLSDDEQNYYDELYKTAIISNEKIYKDLAERYLSYADERLAIEKKFNDDISILQEARKKAETKGDASEIAQIDRSIEKRTEIKNEDIFKLDAEQFKKNMNWEQVFGNLDKVSTDTLKKLKANLKDFISSQKDLSPESLKELVDAIERIDDKVSERDSFETMSISFKSLKEVTDAQREAQKAYNKALEEGTDEEKKNAKATLESAKNSKQKALYEATDALHKGINEIGQYVDAGNQVIGIMETLGIKTPEWMEGTMSGFGEMLNGLGNIDLMKPMSIITGSLQTVKGALTSVISLGGLIPGLGGADYSHYNEMVEEYNKLNEIWDELIDKKLEYINTSYGAEADKVGKEALELVNKSIEAYRILGRERLNSGASAGSHSIGKRMAKNTSSSDWQDIARALDMSVKDAKDFIGTGRMTGLFDLTTEQLEKLKSEAPTFWAKLDGDVRDYLDKIIEGEERIEEIHNQINEQLTQTTFDGVYSNFIDTLMDMKASSKDAAEDVSEYFMQAMLSEQIGTLYQDKLKKWYEKFAKGMEDGSLTESERNALNSEYMGYIEEAMKLRDELAAATGYDKISQESTSQPSTSRGFGTEMTHEDAGELSGRFTALQIAGEEIKNQSTIQSQSLNLLTVKADALLSINTETRNIADDTRDLIAQSYLELVQISENTGAIVKPIQQMQRDIAEVKKNTAKL
nr:MAG TPA: tail tape measure protein [Caudoviricetes sp.]